MTVRLVIFASMLHDSDSVMNSRKDLFEGIRSFANLEIIYSSMLSTGAPECSCYIDGARGAEQSGLKLTNEGDVKTICLIATGGTEELFRSYVDAIPKPVLLLSDAYHNSLAASFEISTYLDRRGIENHILNAPLDCSREYFESLEKFLSSIDETEPAGNDADVLPPFGKNTLHALAHTNIGLLGGESSWLIASAIDKEAVAKRYGVKFVDVSLKEVEELYEACDPASEEAMKIVGKMNKYLTAGRTEEELVKAARMYVALKGVCTRHSLGAITVKCFDILDSCATTACLALALLNDEGIISGCEGDIPSLWSMLYVHLEKGRKAFMANPSSSNRKELTVDFAHCTIPLTMLHGYRLPSHFESSIGIGIQGSLPSGRYGIVKFYGPELQNAYTAEGDVIMNTNVPQRCRTQIRFKFSSEEEFDRFMAHRSGNHCIIYQI